MTNSPTFSLISPYIFNQACQHLVSYRKTHWTWFGFYCLILAEQMQVDKRG